MSVRITVDFSDSRRFRLAVQAGLSQGDANNPIRQWLRQAGSRYEAFARRRFVENSRGAGRWAPLKPATIRGRKRGGSVILRDTGTLFGALTIGSPANLFRDTDGGVMYGIAEVPHPGSNVTVAQIARWHDEGAGNLPRRRILPEATPELRDQIRRDGEKAIARAIKEAERG